MLNQMLSDYVGRLKGGKYTIDARIPDTYLARLSAERVAMKLRGAAYFPRRRHRPFVGAGTRFRARSRLRFGAGTTFGRKCFVDALGVNGVELGHNVSVGVNTRIEATGSLRELGAGFRAGDNVGLGTDCFYGAAGGIEIGSDTIIGHLVSMHSENHVFDDAESPIRLQGVQRTGIKIGRNCWIGAKVTVLDGAQVGDGCVIAAGAVVVAGSYPPGGILAGVPARFIRSRLSTDSTAVDAESAHFPEPVPQSPQEKAQVSGQHQRVRGAERGVQR